MRNISAEKGSIFIFFRTKSIAGNAIIRLAIQFTMAKMTDTAVRIGTKKKTVAV